MNGFDVLGGGEILENVTIEPLARSAVAAFAKVQGLGT